MDKQIELCNICATVGKQSKLKIYQINLEEAVKLCEDEAVRISLPPLSQPKKFKGVNDKSNLEQYFHVLSVTTNAGLHNILVLLTQKVLTRLGLTFGNHIERD